MSKISGIRDLDREILGKLHDKEILIACSIDKYTWNTVCDDAFLKRRLLMKYPKIEKEKYEAETWKRFFLRAVNYISLLKERYGYDYTFGNFVKQYDLLTNYYDDTMYDLLVKSSKEGELALVIWCLNKGANIHISDNLAFRWACKNSHLEVVKYLVEKGADIHAHNNETLIDACDNGHLEMVKYLLDTGANNINSALRWACGKGHLEVIKYLVEMGADLHANEEFALRWASTYGQLETVMYLVENGANIHAWNDEAISEAERNRHFKVVNYLKSKI
jgi:hypothetical protein